MARTFSIGAVLSVTTGRLLSEGGIGDVYAILNWMTGDNLFTHHLPRAIREAAPVLLKQFPQLEAATAEAVGVTPENLSNWVSTWAERYGAELQVPVLGPDQHERIDPLSELAETVHPDRIVVVSP